MKISHNTVNPLLNFNIMKSFAKYILVSGLLCFSAGKSYSALIQSNPSIVAAVLLQTMQLKEAYEKRDESQNKIAMAQAAVAVAMEQVHSIEKDILGYMENASGAVKNLHQLKRIVELTGVEIPRHMKTLTTTIPDNMKNTALVAALPSTYADITAEVTSLTTMVNSLVKGTSYSWGEKEMKEGDQKQQINLLNAAERYYIANEVVSRLESLSYELWILNFKIQTMSWSRLFYELDYEGWCNYYYGLSLVDSIIDDWNRLASK